MMRSFGLIVAVFVLAALAFPARADYFVWQDARSDLTMSYPDTWRISLNRTPGTVLHIRAPANGDMVSCIVRISEDRRYNIYPPRYDDALQQVAYSRAFWENYLTKHDHVDLRGVRDGKGLGRGVAGIAVATYASGYPERPGWLTSYMTVSLYAGKAYLLDCSAERGAFSRWVPLFRSIAGSMDFRKVYHENVWGDYLPGRGTSKLYLTDPRGRSTAY